MSDSNHIHAEHHHVEDAIKLVFRGLIPLIFLTSGIAMLALRIAGWSIILGLPMVIFGITFMIYTYDEVVSKVIPTVPSEISRCQNCGHATPKFPGMKQKDLLCHNCKTEIEKKAKS